MTDQSYQPTLTHLRAFVAVADCRHFGTAAERLGVSQPTLSQALASLEAGLGVKLIERSTRRVLVTKPGEQLLAQARATLDAAERFVSAAAGVGGQLSGPLRIGLIPTVAPYVLPSLLSTLRRELPDLVPLVIEDRTARLLDALKSGALDVAVLALPTAVPGVVELPLYEEEFTLVLPRGHELAGRTNLPLAVLAELPLLLLDEGHCLREQTLDLCRSVDAGPVSEGTRATSLATVVQCVAGGLGVTLVPERAVAVEAGRADLSIASFASPAPGRTIGLVYRSSSAHGGEYGQLAGLIGASLEEGESGESGAARTGSRVRCACGSMGVRAGSSMRRSAGC